MPLSLPNHFIPWSRQVAAARHFTAGLVFFHPHDGLLTGHLLNGLILRTKSSAPMWSRLGKLDLRMTLLQFVSASYALYIDAY